MAMLAPCLGKVIVAGGSGATGCHLVKALLKSPSWSEVVCLGRREPMIEIEEGEELDMSKMRHVEANFEHLEAVKEEFEGAVAAYCVLGTTRKDAGSAEAFRRVDLFFVENFARQAKSAGIENFALLTSSGAKASSWFLYMKTKGEAEEAVKRQAFRRLHIFQPGLLDRGTKARFVEKFAKAVFIPALKVSVLGRGIARSLELAMLRHEEGTVVFGNREISAVALE